MRIQWILAEKLLVEKVPICFENLRNFFQVKYIRDCITKNSEFGLLFVDIINNDELHRDKLLKIFSMVELKQKFFCFQPIKPLCGTGYSHSA
jgi:hypothetical protein